jgi:hypothetical protein
MAAAVTPSEVACGAIESPVFRSGPGFLAPFFPSALGTVFPYDIRALERPWCVEVATSPSADTQQRSLTPRLLL